MEEIYLSYYSLNPTLVSTFSIHSLSFHCHTFNVDIFFGIVTFNIYLYLTLQSTGNFIEKIYI